MRAGDAVAAIVDRDQLERGFRRLSVEHRAVIPYPGIGGLKWQGLSADGTLWAVSKKSSDGLWMLPADDRLGP